MSREQVHGIAGISARTRYQRSWPFAGSADIQPLPHQRFRDTGSRLILAAIAAGHRHDGARRTIFVMEVAA